MSLLTAGVLLPECAVRLARADDVPLYLSDNRIGYIPAPSQRGAFLWTHRWAFNRLSMGTEAEFRPGLPKSVALIGDSIVLGGNPYRAEQRLGPQLSQVSGRTVWPIAAGSWGLQNELQYTEDHPNVVRGVDQVVIVSNSGDFDRPSSWASELTHPRTRPWLVTWRLLLKYVWIEHAQPPPLALTVAPKPLDPAVKALVVQLPRSLIVILYPTRAELGNDMPCGFTAPPALRVTGVRLYCIKRARGWEPKLYRDDIHPTAAGMKLLARYIAGKLAIPEPTSRRR